MRNVSRLGLATFGTALLLSLPAHAQQGGGGSSGGGANGGGYDQSSVYSVARPTTHATESPNYPRRLENQSDRCRTTIESGRRTGGRLAYNCYPPYAQ